MAQAVKARGITMSRPKISFEFFPPKTLDASFRLWETARALAPLAPDFVSVTYGAGGTTRKLTHEAVTTIHRHYGIPVAAHLTCVEATRAETMEIVQAYADAGIRESVALRGDAPKGQEEDAAKLRLGADHLFTVILLRDTSERVRSGSCRLRRAWVSPSPFGFSLFSISPDPRLAENRFAEPLQGEV